jgi:hypothetical protein
MTERPDAGAAHEARALELLRRHDGAERVAQLPYARLITIAPQAGRDDPVHVTIYWGGGTIEQPFPGSTLWRAVLERRLAEPASADPADPADRVLRAQIEHSLARFPDLETWWRWLRTGWLAPPTPPRAPW